MTFIILPTQLFNIKFFPKNEDYILYEHPQYFTKYNYNKKRIMLHRASMKYFFDNFKKKGYKIKYENYKSNVFKNIKNAKIFDPIDKINIPSNYEIIESPNFLCSTSLMQKYRDTTDRFFFNSFYTFMKKELNILSNTKSKDKDNRKRLPKGTVVPDICEFTNESYVNEASEFTNKNFKKNYGNTDNFFYPINEKDVKVCLDMFIKERFKDFGPYEDFFDDKNNYLYHTVLSSSINIGLINPSDIINIIMKIKSKIPINSFEGYVRQLFWREYQRYCYIYLDFKEHNYFGNKKKLTKKWYTGELDILPVDNCIKKAFDIAYLHHIERLMVVGNMMNLQGIDPWEGFKWFMEFSIDSYEWVMHQNVLDMVFFVTGGKTMRKPYISSSNYIKKMSYYKKGPWAEKWDELFHSFLKKNKEQMRKFTYSYPIVKKYL